MTCTVDGCTKPRMARGMCQHHYDRQRAGIPLDAPHRWTAARARYQELADLIRLGETPHIAVQRVGATPAAASRWFYRHGMPELARPLQNMERQPA